MAIQSKLLTSNPPPEQLPTPTQHSPLTQKSSPTGRWSSNYFAALFRLHVIAHELTLLAPPPSKSLSQADLRKQAGLDNNPSQSPATYSLYSAALTPFGRSMSKQAATSSRKVRQGYTGPHR